MAHTDRPPTSPTLLAALLLVALALTACSLASEPIPAGPIETGPMPGEQAESVSLVPVRQPRASSGQAIFEQHCAACHGPSGAGDGASSAQLADQGALLPNFTDPDLARMRAPAEWYQTITNGAMARMMPPWRDTLTDSERWDVAYYLYTLSADAGTLAEGERLYEQHFAEQFGEGGEEIGLDAPGALANVSQQQIIDEYLADAGAELSDDELRAVAAYMQTFGYDPDLAAASEEPAAVAEEAAADEPAPAGDAAEETGSGQPAAETAPATGVVTGQVMMMTPGESLPDGVEVFLRGVAVTDANTVDEFLVQSQPVGPDGAFRFEGLPLDVQRAAYVVEFIYQGVTFQNGAIIDPQQTVMELPLEVHASTTDESVVSVDAMHVVFNQHPDALLVTQLYVFSNSSDRIYVTQDPVMGGSRGSVAISLPPEAYGVQFEEGEIGGRFVPSGDRYYDLSQLPPGSRSHAIIVNYFLPYDGEAEVDIPILYRTEQVTVLAQEGQRARSDQVSEAGSEVIAETPYTKYTGQGLAAGDTLSLEVRTRAQGIGGNTLSIVLAALAGVLLVAGVGYWFLQREEPEPATRADASLPGRAEALVEAIAQLDADFEAGRVNRFEYESRRAELKAELTAALEGEQ